MTNMRVGNFEICRALSAGEEELAPRRELVHVVDEAGLIWLLRTDFSIWDSRRQRLLGFA